jgi:hypothetical protein
MVRTLGAASENTTTQSSHFGDTAASSQRTSAQVTLQQNLTKVFPKTGIRRIQLENRSRHRRRSERPFLACPACFSGPVVMRYKLRAFELRNVRSPRKEHIIASLIGKFDFAG